MHYTRVNLDFILKLYLVLLCCNKYQIHKKLMMVYLLASGLIDLTPVKFEPSPENDDAVIIPDALILIYFKCPAECKF